MKRISIAILALTLCFGMASAQPAYDLKKINKEKLNRGVVALKQTDGKVFISWRILSSDKKGEAFDIFRNGQKLNTQPLTSGGAFYVDENPLASEATYEIKGGNLNGKYTLKADAPIGYIPIKTNKPADGTTPDGRRFTYSANDCSVGDVDGDGQYEIFVKWDPSNAHDNAHDGFTGSTIFDCYRLTGEHLWRIDMGPNIRSGAHYVPFIVYDLDGDGCAELMVKTADGTVDGKGNVIGDATKDWREGAAEAKKNFEKNKEQIKQEEANRAKMREEWAKLRKEMEELRKQGKQPDEQMMQRMRRMRGSGNRGPAKAGRILSGPEYMTVFNGRTGEAMATVDYIPERGELRAWGDDRGNRSERYLAAVGYFDGKRASAVFCRGYYTRTVLAAWDWDGKKLTNKWTFDSNNKKWNSYAGQGNHNLRVGDVDGDGCDEIIYGSCAIDNDGTGLYNTRMGHGDAMHLTAFDPATNKLQVWDCHENRRDGSTFRDAATGEVIFQLKSKIDVGRCMAADIDPTNPGVEMWSSDSKGIRNIKGEVVVPKNQQSGNEGDGNGDDTALYIRGVRVSTNFAIWWDGDLLRELLDAARVSKYNWNTGMSDMVTRFEGCQWNNGSKSNPCLSGDIIGDWREDVLTRTQDSKELRLYVSPIPTDYRINCLMEDIPYRLSVATENVGYNQPPQAGFYIGPDKSVVDYLK